MTNDKKTDEPIPGVVTEAEAAKETPVKAGEKAANERAAANRKQSSATSDAGIVSEADVKEKYSPDKVEAAKNEQAARHRAEAHPASAEPNVISEVEVAAEVHDGEKPSRKRTTKDSTPRTTRSK